MPNTDITPTVHEIRQTLKKIRRIQGALSDEDKAMLNNISVMLSEMYDATREKVAKDATTLQRNVAITKPLNIRKPKR